MSKGELASEGLFLVLFSPLADIINTPVIDIPGLFMTCILRRSAEAPACDPEASKNTQSRGHGTALWLWNPIKWMFTLKEWINQTVWQHDCNFFLIKEGSQCKQSVNQAEQKSFWLMVFSASLCLYLSADCWWTIHANSCTWWRPTGLFQAWKNTLVGDNV